MKEINTVTELRVAIVGLKTAKEELWPVLKEQMLAVGEFYTPQNIVKTAVKKLFIGDALKTVVLNAAFGVTTGLIANSVLRGISIGPFSRFVTGTLRGIVSKKAELNDGSAIKSIGNAILRRVFATT
jgi:hypothetical protein